MKGFEIQINGGAPIVIAAEHYAFALKWDMRKTFTEKH